MALLYHYLPVLAVIRYSFASFSALMLSSDSFFTLTVPVSSCCCTPVVGL